MTHASDHLTLRPEARAALGERLATIALVLMGLGFIFRFVRGGLRARAHDGIRYESQHQLKQNNSK